MFFFSPQTFASFTIWIQLKCIFYVLFKDLQIKLLICLKTNEKQFSALS